MIIVCGVNDVTGLSPEEIAERIEIVRKVIERTTGATTWGGEPWAP